MKFWRPLLDSMAYDPVPGAYRVIAIAILIVLVLFACAGCASTDRYLTEAQDREMREACESQGCAVLSGAAWEQIQRALKMCGFHGT